MILFVTLTTALAAAQPASPALLDDFSDPTRNQRGAERFLVTDKDLGGQSQATPRCEGGIYRVTGELVPGRGMPAFISVPLLLAPDGQPQDLSPYEGVQLRVKVKQGNLSVQVSSSEIQNFDFHISAPIVRKPQEFQLVRLPFKDMKRSWSEQTPLNLKTITSVNLVASGMMKETFAYEVDEIGFY